VEALEDSVTNFMKIKSISLLPYADAMCPAIQTFLIIELKYLTNPLQPSLPFVGSTVINNSYFADIVKFFFLFLIFLYLLEVFLNSKSKPWMNDKVFIE
jgi:hypothetical protein